MLFRHSMSITQQLMHIYNTHVHKNKRNIAFNVAKLLGVMRHKLVTVTGMVNSRFQTEVIFTKKKVMLSTLYNKF